VTTPVEKVAQVLVDLDGNDLDATAAAIIEALRVPMMDRRSGPSLGPAWSIEYAWVDGYNQAIRDILGEAT
jgi:hypothetical protein